MPLTHESRTDLLAKLDVVQAAVDELRHSILSDPSATSDDHRLAVKSNLSRAFYDLNWAIMASVDWSARNIRHNPFMGGMGKSATLPPSLDSLLGDL